MPSGRTHDIITAVATPVVVWTCYHFTDWKTTAIITGLFLFSSLMFNGDLDMESSPYYRWRFLKFIWIPYQKMFHHRSIFTHGLVIGTVIRIIYLAIIPLIILYFKSDINYIKTINMHTIVLALIGLESGAALHTIADYIFT
jgi:uncharacterized metal-binding protein